MLGRSQAGTAQAPPLHLATVVRSEVAKTICGLRGEHKKQNAPLVASRSCLELLRTERCVCLVMVGVGYFRFLDFLPPDFFFPPFGAAFAACLGSWRLISKLGSLARPSTMSLSS